MGKASVTRYCECLSIAGGLRDCPAHGAFATASARRQYEGAIAELTRLLANATDPENAGDVDEAREVGWAHIVRHYPGVANDG